MIGAVRLTGVRAEANVADDREACNAAVAIAHLLGAPVALQLRSGVRIDVAPTDTPDTILAQYQNAYAQAYRRRAHGEDD